MQMTNMKAMKEKRLKEEEDKASKAAEEGYDGEPVDNSALIEALKKDIAELTAILTKANADRQRNIKNVIKMKEESLKAEENDPFPKANVIEAFKKEIAHLKTLLDPQLETKAKEEEMEEDVECEKKDSKEVDMKGFTAKATLEGIEKAKEVIANGGTQEEAKEAAKAYVLAAVEKMQKEEQAKKDALAAGELEISVKGTVDEKPDPAIRYGDGGTKKCEEEEAAKATDDTEEEGKDEEEEEVEKLEDQVKAISIVENLEGKENEVSDEKQGDVDKEDKPEEEKVEEPVKEILPPLFERTDPDTLLDRLNTRRLFARILDFKRKQRKKVAELIKKEGETGDENPEVKEEEEGEDELDPMRGIAHMFDKELEGYSQEEKDRATADRIYPKNMTVSEIAEKEWDELLKVAKLRNTKQPIPWDPIPTQYELLQFSPCPRAVGVLATYPRSGNSLMRTMYEHTALRVTGSDMQGGLAKHGKDFANIIFYVHFKLQNYDDNPTCNILLCFHLSL